MSRIGEEILGPPPTSMEQKEFEEAIAKVIYAARKEHSRHGPNPHHLITENYMARAVRNFLEQKL